MNILAIRKPQKTNYVVSVKNAQMKLQKNGAKTIPNTAKNIVKIILKNAKNTPNNIVKIIQIIVSNTIGKDIVKILKR